MMIPQTVGVSQDSILSCISHENDSFEIQLVCGSKLIGKQEFLQVSLSQSLSFRKAISLYLLINNKPK